MKPGTNGWNTTFVLECHLDHHTLCETILSPKKTTGHPLDGSLIIPIFANSNFHYRNRCYYNQGGRQDEVL